MGSPRTHLIFLFIMGLSIGAACSDSAKTQNGTTPSDAGNGNPDDVTVDALPSSDGQTTDDDIQIKIDTQAEDTSEEVEMPVDVTPPFDDALTDSASESDVEDTTSSLDIEESDIALPSDAEAADTSPNDVEPVEPSGFFAQCFTDKQDPSQPSPNYDQYVFTAAPHCKGTNHQLITSVERVVFLGDSVTVGTPNGEHLLSVDNGHFYRNQLAEWLASEFKLDKGEPFLGWNQWKAYDYGTGKGSKKISGDFANCAKWGGRCDDLMDQSESCFGGNSQSKRTLTVFTVGGNDVAKLTQVGGEASDEEVAAGYPEAWQVAQEAVADLEESVKWLKDPANFPNGSYVVFGTPFEFTDGTGKVDACTPETKIKVPGIGVIDLTQLNLNVAALAGYQEWKDPSVQREIVVWMLEEFLRIAATYKADMIWMAESFCGHGYVAAGPNADPNNACYEGPDADLWFDETCTHPSPAGHAALYDMFRTVIEE